MTKGADAKLYSAFDRALAEPGGKPLCITPAALAPRTRMMPQLAEACARRQPRCSRAGHETRDKQGHEDPGGDRP